MGKNIVYLFLTNEPSRTTLNPMSRSKNY